MQHSRRQHLFIAVTAVWFFVGCQANSGGERTDVATDSDADGSSADVPDGMLDDGLGDADGFSADVPDSMLDDGVGDADVMPEEDTATMDVEELPELSEWWVNPECPTRDPSFAIVFPPTMEIQWQVERANASFASPAAFDINDDCVRDIIVGSGTEGPTEGSVDALDGATGETLWHGTTVGEVYSRPQLLPRSQTDSGLLISAGRSGTFAAHDLLTGTDAWRFDLMSEPVAGRWNNFGIPQVIPDVDGDGVPDLVTTSGAISKDAEAFEEREVNYLLLVSGATGALLRVDAMPDGRETYMSPVVWNRDEPWIVWGSGGETFSGSLWGAPLSELSRLDSPLDARELATSTTWKGFIAPPGMMDVNGDNREDLVVVAFDGRVMMLDGVTGEIVWTWGVEGYESYSSPAIGLFDEDGVPDIAVLLNEGVWADKYTGTLMVVLSGEDGQLLWSEVGVGVYAPSPVMSDLDGDGRQEVIFIDPGLETSTVRLVHSGVDESLVLDTVSGTGLSSPWIDDLDYDGVLDMVTVTAVMDRQPLVHTVRNYTLNAPPSTGGWYGYLNRSGESRAEQ